MSAASPIRRLIANDTQSFLKLRQKALTTEPLAFGSSPSDDRFREPGDVERLLHDQHENAVFGSFVANQVVGMVGVVRAGGAKERHKANIWRMYVEPASRRTGIGRELLETCITYTTGWLQIRQIHLSVTAPSEAARALYESAGFELWGTEPNALQHDGKFVDELHLSLRIR